MEEEYENSRHKDGGSKIVSGYNLVASIPPVRIRHRVGVDVPAIVLGVPVGVHGPESLCARYHLCHHPSNTLRIVSYAETLSP